MGCQRRQQLCALLTAVLCLAPLAAAKAYAGTHHFALSVQQAKVCRRFVSILHLCFLHNQEFILLQRLVEHVPNLRHVRNNIFSRFPLKLVVECMQARDRFQPPRVVAR